MPPTIRRQGGSTGSSFTANRKPLGAAKPAASGNGNLKLNLAASEPVVDIGQTNWLIHGDWGIGKTGLANQFPKSYFLLFEPGGRGLKMRKNEVYSWLDCKEYITLLAKTSLQEVQTVVFDVADDMYELCYDWYCEKKGITNPGDLKWGEGWKGVRKEFEETIKVLAHSGKSLVFLSHTKDREFQRRSGTEYRKLVPSMGTQATNFICGFVDVIAWYGYYGQDRYLTIRGSENLEAKNRLGGRFRTPSGKRIHSIPMFDEANPDFDETNAYQNLLKAFNNRQGRIHVPDMPMNLSNLPKKKQTQR